jgi:hypothetical protein
MTAHASSNPALVAAVTSAAEPSSIARFGMTWDCQLLEGIGFWTTARGGSRGRRGWQGIIDQILKWPIHLIFNISECALD